MAMKGHKRQGYCPLTITENADGSTTEALGAGVLTSHVVSFTGTFSGDDTDLWAGDTKELSEGATSGSVQFVLSDLPMQDEAAFGGHTYTEAAGIVEKDTDSRPYLRYGAIGVGARKDDATGKQETFYRVVEYYKVMMTPVDDAFSTKQQSVSWQTHSCSGTCYYNAEGIRRKKQDFDTFEAALAELRTFLNIPTE